MKLRLTVVTLSAVVLAGCFGKTLDFRNAEISNGKLYQEGANEPFSGKVSIRINTATDSHLKSATHSRAKPATEPHHPHIEMGLMAYGLVNCAFSLSGDTRPE
jgi:hypothetical protein